MPNRDKEGRPHITYDLIKETLDKTYGAVGLAAEKLEIERRTLYYHLDKHPDLKEYARYLREKHPDKQKSKRKVKPPSATKPKAAKPARKNPLAAKEAKARREAKVAAEKAEEEHAPPSWEPLEMPSEAGFDTSPARANLGIDDLDYQKVQRALRHQRGLISQTAKVLGTTRDTLERYMKARPALQRIAEQEREGVKDLLESAAWQKALGVWDEGRRKWIERPSEKMQMFLLKTFAQDRGYYDGPQFGQGNPNQTITINLTGAFVEADKDEVVEAEVVPELEEAKSE